MRFPTPGRDPSNPPPSTSDAGPMPAKERLADESLNQHTVLIVDGEVLRRETYWCALQEAGYRGVATANSRDVLDVMYAENVSVILLDLPQAAGIETLKAIKRVSPETLVITMSEDDADCPAAASRLGADAIIRKPATAQAVVETVTALTSRRSSVSQTDRRRYTRLKVNQRGYLFNPLNDQPMQCKVVNLSAGGALIEAASECPPDRPVILEVDGFGRFEGVVVHTAQGLTGFKFLMGELKRDRLKQALADFAKHGVAEIASYGVHPNFKPAGNG